MTIEIINKIIISEEAVFDYEEVLCLGLLDKRTLKAEVEEYINLKNRSGQLIHNNYFRCKYQDPETGRMLMLFICRAERLSIMQMWRIDGICFEEEWSEEAEEGGSIRHWLKSKITEPEKGDWVIEQRTRAAADKIILGYEVRGSIEGLPKEIKYAIEYGNNKELAEAISVLQNAGGKRAWGKILARAVKISRKLDKRAERGRL